MGGWVDGWLENDLLKKIPSPKFVLESLLGTFDFGVCQQKPVSSADVGSVLGEGLWGSPPPKSVRIEFVQIDSVLYMRI